MSSSTKRFMVRNWAFSSDVRIFWMTFAENRAQAEKKNDDAKGWTKHLDGCAMNSKTKTLRWCLSSRAWASDWNERCEGFSLRGNLCKSIFVERERKRNEIFFLRQSVCNLFKELLMIQYRRIQLSTHPSTHPSAGLIRSLRRRNFRCFFTAKSRLKKILIEVCYTMGKMETHLLFFFCISFSLSRSLVLAFLSFRDFDSDVST